MNQYFVYLITNKNNTVIYCGMTNDLQRRVFEHKNKLLKGFTSRYNCNKLVYFEEFEIYVDGFTRERQIKSGSRQKKIDLIISNNPDWMDLAEDWFE